MKPSRRAPIRSFRAVPTTGDLGAGPHPRRRVGLLGAAGLLALSLLVALSAGGGPAHAAFPGENGRIYCAGERSTAQPPAGPDPSRPAFDRNEIFSMNPDGSDVRVLTNNAVLDFDPAVSPDGKKVVFESQASGSSELYAMNSDGTNVRRITFSPGAERVNGWTPDSRRIYYHTNPDGINLDVFVMNADGSDAPGTNLTRSPEADDPAPVGSPDGRKVAWHSNRDDPRGSGLGNHEVYTINADGSGVRRLTTAPENDLFPNWSPDGRQIVFESFRAGVNGSAIFRMGAETGEAGGLTLLTDGPGLDRHPIWSPDGTRILFDSTRDTPSGQPANRDVYTMNAADGGDVRRLTTQAGSDQRCDWARVPDVRPLGVGLCPTARVGTEGADTINGTPGGDRIFGLGGRDILNGVQGADCLFGGEGNDSVAGSTGQDLLQGDAGNDTLKGGSSADRLSGGGGRDRVLGAAGNDRLSGGAGNDSLDGGRGRNSYSAGSGNDSVNSANGRRETVNCGSGRRDVVRADRSDRLRGCERRRVVR